jgi:hypothetical protein
VVPFTGEEYVGLVWAADDTFDDATRMKVVGALIDSGCRYLVCGGVDCEQWHDDTDVAFASLEASSDADVPFVMTTWHYNESVEDVVFFATYCTSFDDYDFKCLLVLVVGKESERADFAAQISQALRAPIGEPNDPSTPAGRSNRDVFMATHFRFSLCPTTVPTQKQIGHNRGQHRCRTH